MKPEAPDFSLAIVWAAPIPVSGDMVTGHLSLTHGSLTSATLEGGQGSLEGDAFSFAASAPARLNLTIAGPHLGPGAHATLLTVENNYHSFSLFLRDVNPAFPLYVPDCAAAITTANDPRTYAEIAADVARLNGSTRIQRLEREPEESFEAAAPLVRRQPNCPTWLGIGRDFRTFQVNFRQNGEVWDPAPVSQHRGNPTGKRGQADPL
jgi:hypothetical protein